MGLQDTRMMRSIFSGMNLPTKLPPVKIIKGHLHFIFNRGLKRV
jgi:hypothetical protein